MRHAEQLLAALACALLACACHHVDHWPDDPRGNLEALWTEVDRHYCYFDEKGIDWDSVRREYLPRVDENTNVIELYSVMADMLDELRDGHVNLTSPFGTTYYKKWWSDYPQNYDQRLVEQYYLHFGGLSRGGLTYAVLPDTIAYVRYTSFAYALGEGTLDWVIALTRGSRAMIIDLRDNGGGDMTNVERLTRRFIDRRILAGSISHKTGPGHGDFSSPYKYYYDPAEPGRLRWTAPVILLTNRSTFSAANNFTAIMRTLPQVTQVGDRTGGGSGMPWGTELPCGWAVRMSGSPVYDPMGRVTEWGVDPDVHVDLDPEAALSGRDTMLDAAIELARQYPVVHD